MKVVLLAGGLGTRPAEETDVKPKPMVEIGGYPRLWHIMQAQASQGFNEFMVALGYEGEVIKQYFLNLFSANCDLKVKLVTGSVCDVDIKALYAFHKQHGRLATNKRLEGSMGLSVAGW